MGLTSHQQSVQYKDEKCGPSFPLPNMQDLYPCCICMPHCEHKQAQTHKWFVW